MCRLSLGERAPMSAVGGWFFFCRGGSAGGREALVPVERGTGETKVRAYVNTPAGRAERERRRIIITFFGREYTFMQMFQFDVKNYFPPSSKAHRTFNGGSDGLTSSGFDASGRCCCAFISVFFSDVRVVCSQSQGVLGYGSRVIKDRVFGFIF